MRECFVAHRNRWNGSLEDMIILGVTIVVAVLVIGALALWLAFR
jgi:hypothetical protein